MLNCEQASRLASESLDHKLPLWQRMNLWMHLSMCRLCSGFSSDIQQLREAAQRQAEEIEDDSAPSDISLSPDARQSMRRALEKLDS